MDIFDAAAAGDHAALSRVLFQGGDLGAFDAQGWTAAFHAARGGHANCLELLLDAGCGIETKSGDQKTIFALALDSPTPECIHVLVDDSRGKRPTCASNATESACAEPRVIFQPLVDWLFGANDDLSPEEISQLFEQADAEQQRAGLGLCAPEPSQARPGRPARI